MSGSSQPYREAERLLEELEGKGIEVRAEATKIMFRPKSLVTSEEIAKILRLKPDLMLRGRLRN